MTQQNGVKEAFDVACLTQKDMADIYNHLDTIKRALLIADKLMQEPSEALFDKVYEYLDEHKDFSEQRHEVQRDAYVHHLVKLVRDQILKEVEGAR